MPFAPTIRALVRAVFTHAARRLAALVAALPLVVSLPLAGVPIALGASSTVTTLAHASAPIHKPLMLPMIETRQPWPEEVGSFARRLEDAFGIDERRADTFAGWILEASARQQVPPELIAGLIHTESSFRMRARSWAGAVGPTQVKPNFWQDFCGGRDLTDPEHNVYCGAQVLVHYMQQCGEFDCALRLYNVGPGNMRKPAMQRASHRYLAKVEGHRSRLLDSVAGAVADVVADAQGVPVL